MQYSTSIAVRDILCRLLLFFFNDTATTDIYTLSLHDALPICCQAARPSSRPPRTPRLSPCRPPGSGGKSSRRDRKSTRLNSSHVSISYAVFCLKKKNKQINPQARKISTRTLRNQSSDPPQPFT